MLNNHIGELMDSKECGKGEKGIRALATRDNPI